MSEGGEVQVLRRSEPTREELIIEAELERREQLASWELVARGRMADFVREAWPVVEPQGPLLWNWHLDVLCEALEKVSRGEIKKLVICIPPGMMKSLLVSVLWPAWEWLWNPGRRKMFLANDDTLVRRDSRRTRGIISSDWYQGLLAYLEETRGLTAWSLASDQNEKDNFENTARGFRQCQSINTSVTGKRADDIVIDDPLDAPKLIRASADPTRAKALLERVNDTIEKGLITRVNRNNDPRWVMIMQRLHIDDPAGRAIRAGGWTVISLPMEYDPDLPEDCGGPPSPGFDHRSQPGELLFPGLMGREKVEEEKVSLGAREVAAQHGQRPTIPGGGLFKRSYWRYYDLPPHRQGPQLDEVAISIDCTFKKSEHTDRVSLQVWGRKGLDYYLLDDVTERMTFTETIHALDALRKKWPIARLVLIEEKANGPAMMDLLRHAVPYMVPFLPDGYGSKSARAQVSAYIAEGGRIWLPRPEYAHWVEKWEHEHETFKGTFDDRVDAASQLLIYWSEGSSTTGAEAMKAAFGWIAGG